MRIPPEHISFLKKYYPMTKDRQFLVDHLKRDWKQIASQAAYLGIRRFVKYKRMPEAIEKSRLFHLGRKRSRETCLKISLKMRCKKPWITGKHHSEETKRKIGIANKGKIPWITGRKMPAEVRHKISIAGKGRKHSWETRKILSILRKKERKNLEIYKDHMIRAYKEGYSANKIGVNYGVHGNTIIRRLRKWGESINNSKFNGHLFQAKDGHFLRSRAEKLIDDKLNSLGVGHIVEKKIANSRYKCDWYLPDFDVYIEYWGLSGKESYDKRKDKKIRIYKNNGLKLISLYPNKTDKLERKLIPILELKKVKNIQLTDFL
ncbi:MAG: hypothetical protein KKC75_03755 [Nanoarchaeota archaeon]|nr:hypothetical protein [Nanoarchaeota archaeon]MBU1005644.1 hypothetical protein [Nanoarchaeota archaeon]MBU1945813.1 hypothetical protein [Nanoarchaeota archaeon]